MSTVRMNISIPTDVRERMSQTPDVNWSAVAVLAFQRVMDGDRSHETAEQLREIREEIQVTHRALNQAHVRLFDLLQKVTLMESQLLHGRGLAQTPEGG